MQIDHKPLKVLAVGKSGSGKTTLILRLVENLPHKHVFIYDHKREFQVRLGIIPATSPEEMIERLEKGERYIAYAPDVEWPGDKEAGFQFFAEWVFEIARAIQSQCLFVCDEVNRFINTSAGGMGWEFKQLIEDGRLQGLDFLGTAHGANSINTNLRAQLTEVYALKTIDKKPLEFLTDCGFDADEVRKLNTGEFINRDMDNDEFTRGKLFLTPRDAPDNDAEETPPGDSAENTIDTDENPAQAE